MFSKTESRSKPSLGFAPALPTLYHEVFIPYMCPLAGAWLFETTEKVEKGGAVWYNVVAENKYRRRRYVEEYKLQAARYLH